MKIRETFEYEVYPENMNDVFTIKDYINCVDDMPCPFWDGYEKPYIINRKIEIIDRDY